MKETIHSDTFSSNTIELLNKMNKDIKLTVWLTNCCGSNSNGARMSEPTYNFKEDS